MLHDIVDGAAALRSDAFQVSNKLLASRCKSQVRTDSAFGVMDVLHSVRIVCTQTAGRCHLHMSIYLSVM
jgi:hypothetical protein